jgi:hypothetical protein
MQHQTTQLKAALKQSVAAQPMEAVTNQNGLLLQGAGAVDSS